MEKQEQAKPVRGQNLLEWYEALISAALVLVLIFSFFFRIIQVDGSSMVPTLVNGDKLIVWGAGYTPQRGDVVIVDSYTSYGKPLVKRVIAKGGDTVSIDYATGTVAVNGRRARCWCWVITATSRWTAAPPMWAALTNGTFWAGYFCALCPLQILGW